ncbi:MAG: fluoride efflux transporter CrcB [Bacteroidetes bacterium]|nr:MAG: fluoride efflux transporter CrcB [Bacteroidota bacterium]
MNNWWLVFVGGGIGSMVRLAFSKMIPWTGQGFPWATFWANMLACVVMGLGWAFLSRRPELPESWKILILTGFCGGFSTFSTFSLESLRLIQQGEWLMALSYVLASVLICFAALALAVRAGMM